MSEKKTEKKDEREAALVPQEQAEKIVLTADFGAVYVKRSESGQLLRPVKARMMLTERAGHFYKISGKYAISGTGYVYLNKVASVSIVTPPKVFVDGHEMGNPYVERSKKTKAIETVNVHKMGIGYNPAGNIVVVDKTLFYNVYTYFIQSIQAKMKEGDWDKKPQGWRKGDPLPPKYPRCAVIGTFEDRPADTFVKDASWAFFETQPPLGLWVDYTNEAIQRVLEEHTQRQRFGDRIAQKIVERNILKDHPAIGVTQVEPNEAGQAAVMVWGYRHDLQPQDFQNIQAQAERGDQTIDVAKEDITQVMSDEEKAAIKEQEIAEATESDDKDKTPEPPTDLFPEGEVKK